ncbi:MAG TPA: hypothetical protein VLY03_09700 [Bacteroidota bacterium]|nr:hypothetical protein [Bacteroidota bacterium]
MLSLLIVLAGLQLLSCSHGDTNSAQPETATQLVGDGWQAYANQQYQTALSKFTAAIGLDGNMVDAFNGAGWASAKLGQLANAATQFGRGNVRDTNNTDILAGLALVDNANKNYSVSATDAQSLLLKNSHWFFERDTGVDYNDIRVVLEEDYFAVGSFDLSLAIVRQVNPSFSADVSTVQGQAALAQEIERQRNLYQ